MVARALGGCLNPRDRRPRNIPTVDPQRWDSAQGPPARAKLGEMFRRYGYARSGRWKDAPGQVHRGYELRFAAADERERDTVADLLRATGVRSGTPFRKGRQWRIPVYGREAVARLLADFRGRATKGSGPRPPSRSG
ncbi:MAG: hypothetical protein HYY17_02830 [Planctomycetes bacterium]|nr:hypothetical protein [Planctomycetota bacterium]